MAMINDIGLLVEKQFKNRKSFTTKELLSFMEKWKPAVSASTYIWTIHRLLQEDIIHPLKKGVYTLEKKSRFNPEIDNTLKSIYSNIKNEFPYIDFCVWESRFVDSYMQHLTKNHFIIVDVEKDVMESVYYSLRDKFPQVFNNPDSTLVEDYISDLDRPIVIRRLISESPLMETQGIISASIEKILVDIFDSVDFFYLQGNELTHVYSNIFERYTINESRLYRYASRKGKKEKIQKFVGTIKNKA